LLTEFISFLGNERVTIELVGGGLKVVSGHTQTTIKGTPAEDFPVLPNHTTTTETTVPATALRAALEGSIFAAANDESRPEISGTLLALSGSTGALVATDSYRLAERKITTLAAVTEDRRVILPSRTAQELLRLTPDDGTIITIFLGDDQARFTLPDTEIVSRVIEGQYPDYQQIIPTAWATKVTCSREELLANVRATSLFCKAGINDVTIVIDPTEKSIHLSAANTQLGEHAASLAAEIEGVPMSGVFNYRYLLDGIQSLGGSHITIELQDQNAPAVLRSPDHKDALYLLMPIRQ
jgi:DNA polymerase-3 subunit beta